MIRKDMTLKKEFGTKLLKGLAKQIKSLNIFIKSLEKLDKADPTFTQDDLDRLYAVRMILRDQLRLFPCHDLKTMKIDLNEFR